MFPPLVTELPVIALAAVVVRFADTAPFAQEGEFDPETWSI